MFNEEVPYDEYEYENTKDTKEKLWKTSFGLQKVDGLRPSQYLVDLSRQEINGELTYREVSDEIERYYSNSDVNKDTEEADKVSVRIAEWLSYPRPFDMSTRRLKQIHAHLFTNVASFTFPVGRFRDVNISKPEPVLNGASVFYELWNMIDSALAIDFDEEQSKNYAVMSEKDKAYSAMSFISNVWQVHPFREGNTRTMAVFAIDYFRSLDFDIDNSLFEEHSLYFRNALVRDNCLIEWQTDKYLNAFTDNLLLAGHHDLEAFDLTIESLELEDDFEMEM